VNDLKFVIEIIVIIISVAGSIIALMAHIDRKIDTMRNEIKEDNREIRKYIFDYMDNNRKRDAEKASD
jgi:cell division protein FtsL